MTLTTMLLFALVIAFVVWFFPAIFAAIGVIFCLLVALVYWVIQVTFSLFKKKP